MACVFATCSTRQTVRAGLNTEGQLRNNQTVLVTSAEGVSSNPNVTANNTVHNLDQYCELINSHPHNTTINVRRSDNMLSEFIAKHLFERSIFYSQAKFTVEVDSLTTEKIIEAILRELD